MVTDLVFFAGPVVVSASMQKLGWRRPTRVIPIECIGSSTCQSLGYSLRDSAGRILPNLLARYAPDLSPGRIAFAAFSAGWGLLDELARHPADLADIDAYVLSDAVYDGKGATRGKPGYVAFGVEAARGRKLLVSTTGNTTSGAYLGAFDSMRLVWDEVQARTGVSSTAAAIPPGLPPPSSGLWRMGQMYWLRYVRQDGSSDMAHLDQHALAPLVWQAYLVPWLARRSWGSFAAGAGIGLFGTLGAFSVLRPKRRRRTG